MSSGEPKHESQDRGHHRDQRPARTDRRAPAAPRARLADRRPRSPADARAAQGHRAPSGRPAQQEGARRVPRRRRRRAGPPRRDARPAGPRRRSSTRGTSPAPASCSSTASTYAVPKVVLLSIGQRLRPATRQPAVPHRGRAAARRAAVPADARSRRDRSPGVDVPVEGARHRDRDPAPGPHPRPGAQRAVELPAHRSPAGAARLRPDGAARSTCTTSRRRSSARSRPGGAGSTTSSVQARCRCLPSSRSSAASRAAIPHPLARPLLRLAFAARGLELPGRGARFHPLRLHGRWPPRDRRAGVSAAVRAARDHPRGGGIGVIADAHPGGGRSEARHPAAHACQRRDHRRVLPLLSGPRRISWPHQV